MNIEFKSEKLEQSLSNYKWLEDKFGRKIARDLVKKINALQAAMTLRDISSNPPYYRHLLKGNKAGIFAIDIANRKYRLCFIPMNGDLNEGVHTVTHIKIVEFSNHYKKIL